MHTPTLWNTGLSTAAPLRGCCAVSAESMVTLIVIAPELHLVSSPALAACPQPMHLGHSTGPRSTEVSAPRSECGTNFAWDSPAVDIRSIFTKPYASNTFDMTANAILLSLGAHCVITAIYSGWYE